MKKIHLSPLLIIVLSLALLPACSRSKSNRDRNRLETRQRTFNDRGIPAENSWTREEKICVQRARAENYDPSECFAGMIDARNRNGMNRNRMIDNNNNGIDDRDESQNGRGIPGIDNNGGNVSGGNNGVNSGRGGQANVGPWVQPCVKPDHRDHKRVKPGEKCAECEACHQHQPETTGPTETDDCVDPCEGISHKHPINVTVAPPSYNGGGYVVGSPNPVQTAPPIIGSPYPTQPALPAQPPRVPAPPAQPYVPAPPAQPYVPAPPAHPPVVAAPPAAQPPIKTNPPTLGGGNPAQNIPPAPVAPAPIAQPPALKLPALPGAPVSTAPITQPEQPLATGSAICGDNGLGDNKSMILQLAVYRNQNTRASDALIDAGSAAFNKITNFRSASIVRVAQDKDYASIAGTRSATSFVSLELAEALTMSLPLSTGRGSACDTNLSGECVIIEKEPSGRVSVYALASDNSRLRPEAKNRTETVTYFRQDITSQAVHSMATRALMKSPVGYYLFSKASLTSPITVVCGQMQVGAAPASSGYVAQPAVAYSAAGTGAKPGDQLVIDTTTHYNNKGGAPSPVQAGSASPEQSTTGSPVEALPPQGSVDQPIAPVDQDQIEREYAQVKAEADAEITRRMEANCRLRESQLRQSGPKGAWNHIPEHELAPCEDPRKKFEDEQRAQIAATRSGGVFYLCAVKLTLQNRSEMFIARYGQEKQASGFIYCKPSNGAPTQRTEIEMIENQGLSFGLELGEAGEHLFATGIGWANGTDGLIEIGEYHYIIQAGAAVPLLGGLGLTPLIFGSNRAAGEGPVLALAFSGIKPFSKDAGVLRARVNIGGKFTIGPKG